MGNSANNISVSGVIRMGGEVSTPVAPITLNPSDMTTGITLTNNNLTFNDTAAGAFVPVVRATKSFDVTDADGFYWEFRADIIGGAQIVGIMPDTVTTLVGPNNETFNPIHNT